MTVAVALPKPERRRCVGLRSGRGPEASDHAGPVQT